MNLKQALQRIEELERRVKELETRPTTVIHNYPITPIAPYVAPLPGPVWQEPSWVPHWPTVTCGASGKQQ